MAIERGDFYEDDEPVEDIQRILLRRPDGVTAQPAARVTITGPFALGLNAAVPVEDVRSIRVRTASRLHAR